MKMRLALRAEVPATINHAELERILERSVKRLCLHFALQSFGASVFDTLRDDHGNEVGGLWFTPIFKEE